MAIHLNAASSELATVPHRAHGLQWRCVGYHNEGATAPCCAYGKKGIWGIEPLTTSIHPTSFVPHTICQVMVNILISMSLTDCIDVMSYTLLIIDVLSMHTYGGVRRKSVCLINCSADSYLVWPPLLMCFLMRLPTGSTEKMSGPWSQKWEKWKTKASFRWANAPIFWQQISTQPCC